MSQSLNRVELIGRLGADPETRRLNDGSPVVNLKIATSESWRDKQSGERREKTEWHKVTIFNEGLCKVAEQYLTKGAHVYLSGSLQTRKWQDQSGADRYSTEIVLQKYRGELVMLGGKSDRPERPQDEQQSGYESEPVKRATYADRQGGGGAVMPDDDIPFAAW